MIIECSSCNSRFRLDTSKITGRGARVRCRKCGQPITVMKDDVDGQGGTGAAGTGEPEEGLDLRSILREAMETPVTPAPMTTDGQEPREARTAECRGGQDDRERQAQDARERPATVETTGADALQSDFEKMLADTGKKAELDTAPPPAEPPAPALGGDVLRSTGGTSAATPADVQVPRAQDALERPQPGGQTVDFGPEEELTFPQPGRKEPASTDGRVPREPGRREPPGAVDGGSGRAQPPAAAAPAPSSEFMMSTADSLDFLKADYDKGGRGAALDISGNLRIAPAPGAGDTGVAPPLGTQAAPTAAAPVEPPSRSDAIRSELAGLGSAGAAAAGKAPAAGQGRPGAATPTDVQVPWERPGAGRAGAAAAPPRAKVAAPSPLRETTAPRPSPAVRRAPGKKSPPLKRGQGSQLVRPSVVLLLLLFFALAGGGAYLGFTNDGQKVLRGLVPQIESLWLGGGKPASSRYEVGNLIGYYEMNAAAGRMFIIKGQVTNEGQLRKTGVRVSAVLLDAKNKKVAEKTVYAGNVLVGDALRKAARDKIEAAMSNPIGGGLANMDIPPGTSVPFMVVFFDAPDGIDSYRLEPKDVD